MAMAKLDVLGSNAPFGTSIHKGEMITPIESTVRMQGDAGSGEGRISGERYEVGAWRKNHLIEPGFETIQTSLSECFGSEGNNHLHSEIRKAHNFDEIIGNSP